MGVQTHVGSWESGASGLESKNFFVAINSSTWLFWHVLTEISLEFPKHEPKPRIQQQMN